MRALIPLLACAGVASATPLPTGKRAVHPRPTHVVVRAADLDAQGSALRLAPGVAVARASRGVTVVGPIEVTGRIDPRALGARICREVELRDAKGAVVGRAAPGALVSPVGTAGAGKILVEPAAPLGGRFVIDASAAGAEPCELVMPVPENALQVVTAPVALAAAPRGAARVPLAAGARVEPLAPADASGWQRVRTYGAMAVEGWLPSDRLRPADAASLPEAPARGLTPTHEAFVDTPVFADGAGRRPVGKLLGGALVTVGVEASGPRVKVMTHGDVVGELWAPLESLRKLESSVWAEGR